MPPLPLDSSTTHKRALPARHHVLTETVKAALARQANRSKEAVLDGRVVLTLLQPSPVPDDYTFHPPTPTPTPTPTGTPTGTPTETPITTLPRYGLRDLPKRSRRRLPARELPIVPISDAYYLKRHLKHEREEKKQKNREKERLQHELLQQEQMVTRIKSLDRSTLLTIVSSLRHREEALDLEALHDCMLEEAEDTLRRYEMLGLRHPRVPKPKPKPKKEEPLLPSVDTPRPPKPKPAEEFDAFYVPVGTRPPSSGSSFSSRRSQRHMSAFGHKLPMMRRSEFVLPLKEYGDIIHDRIIHPIRRHL